MSSNKKLLQGASGFNNLSGSADNVEDYFDVTLWNGSGAANAPVRTGVNLAGYAVNDVGGDGGMIMIRSAHQNDWVVTDTVRGKNSQLATNKNDAANTATNCVTQFFDYGFKVHANPKVNKSGVNNLAYTFGVREKFFDIQTYTGSGSGGKTVSHNLGMMPSMVWIKCISTGNPWVMWHKKGKNQDGSYFSATNQQYYMQINNTSSYQNPGGVWLTSLTDSAITFAVGYGMVNQSNQTYIMYLFGDYEDENSLISSGDYTGAGTSYVDVNVGFEPQWILIKKTSPGQADNYRVFHHKTGLVNEEPYTADHDQPQSLGLPYGWSEAAWGVSVKADGFRIQGHNIGTSGHSYLYTAIRRPFMGTPTDYREVFSYTNQGSNSTTPAFGRNSRNATDFGFYCPRSNGELKFGARILQKNELTLRNNQAMDSPNNSHPRNNMMFNIANPVGTGYTLNGLGHHRTDYGWWNTYYSNVDAWSWTRWKGICDIQTYRTTGSNITLKHSLGAVPEFMGVKGLYGGGSGYTSDWRWYHKDMVASNNAQYYLSTLNANAASNSGYSSTPVWQNTTPTDENVYIGTDQHVNSTQDEACVWIGFASYPDRVDVGYYTGNGTHTNNSRLIQTNLNANGYIRMVLVKPVSQTGSWYWTDYASHGYYWLWNRNLGRIQSSPYPPLSCSYYGNSFYVFTNVSTNHESSELGSMPLNKSGVRYVYVAFG